MTKQELLNWLHQQEQQWQTLLDEIGPERMELPGVNGDWTMKDIVAHHHGWNRRLIGDIAAAQRGETVPPPWPAHFENEDDINTWIYQTYRNRPLTEVLDETRQGFQQLRDIIASLPDDVKIEREWRLIHLNGKRYPAGEFFDHFHDDHEPDIRAWLASL